MGRASPTKPWPDAMRSVPLPPLRAPITGKPRLDVAEILRGKHILLIGTTGFVGKVALSMLLHRYPDVGKVFCLVRPGAGNTADERFFSKVATVARCSIRCASVHGDGYEAFMRAKIVADRRRHRPPAVQLHRRAVRRARRARRHRRRHQQRRPGVVHAVARERAAHQRDGREERARRRAQARRAARATSRPATSPASATARCGRTSRSSATSRARRAISRDWGDEDELLDRDFDPRGRDRRLPEDHRSGARAVERSPAHLASSASAAPSRCATQRRDPDDENDLKIAVARERKIWMNDVLTKLGMERARHWGWTNTYTYTKSLGEQIILSDRDGAGRRSCGRPSSRARCAIRSPAGTRASTRPRR